MYIRIKGVKVVSEEGSQNAVLVWIVMSFTADRVVSV